MLGVLSVLLSGVGASAQPPEPYVVEPPPNATYPFLYGQGEASAKRLRSAPPQTFEFDRAVLRDVLRFLADAAEIPFVGIPESDAANRRLVTLTMRASPFVALESVCRDNGIRLTFENGVWYMSTVDEDRESRLKEEKENKLEGKIYHLHNDPVDRVDFKDAGAATAQATTTSATTIPLQNSQRVFHSKEPRIVNEIRIMLGLPPIKYNPDGTVQGEAVTAGTNVASTDQTANLQTGTSAAAPGSADAAAAPPQRLNPTYVPPQTPQVIYNSDNNTLWVVATSAQHKWVVDYLLAVDLPQDLIAIEVKFFETSKDPSKAYGINWAGTFGGKGLTFNGQAQASGSGGVTVTTSNGNNANTSNNLTASNQIGTGPQTVGNDPITGALTLIPGVPPYSYSQGTGINAREKFSGQSYNATFNAPYSAVLSMDQASLSIKAFMQDTDTTVVQYPRVLTVNNREVAISSAVNTPILSSSQTTGSGGTSTSTQQVNYFPIGTQINILPKTVGKEEIAMSVAITISSYVSDKSIGGNLYPVTASRIYNAALQVSQGYTLAVGGLETTDDRASNDGVPVMRDIPLVGQLFKSKGRARNKKNLIIFITPTIIANTKATRGISESPQTTIPIRPNDPMPPAFTPDGQLVGGTAAINPAFAWFDFQIKWFKQINKENRTDRETIKQLRAVISSVRMLAKNIADMQENADPVRAQALARHEERAMATLTELNKILSYAQNNIM
ncbi:MAG: type II and III secretion system protein [Verrucomicrobiae bacterium]